MAEPLHISDVEPLPLPGGLTTPWHTAFVVHTSPEDVIAKDEQVVVGETMPEVLAPQDGQAKHFAVAFATESLSRVLMRDPRSSVLQPLPLREWRYARELAHARTRKERLLARSAPTDVNFIVSQSRHSNGMLRGELVRQVKVHLRPIMDKVVQRVNAPSPSRRLA